MYFSFERSRFFIFPHPRLVQFFLSPLSPPLSLHQQTREFSSSPTHITPSEKRDELFRGGGRYKIEHPHSTMFSCMYSILNNTYSEDKQRIHFLSSKFSKLSIFHGLIQAIINTPRSNENGTSHNIVVNITLINFIKIPISNSGGMQLVCFHPPQNTTSL